MMSVRTYMEVLDDQNKQLQPCFLGTFHRIHMDRCFHCPWKPPKLKYNGSTCFFPNLQQKWHTVLMPSWMNSSVNFLAKSSKGSPTKSFIEVAIAFNLRFCWAEVSDLIRLWGSIVNSTKVVQTKTSNKLQIIVRIQIYKKKTVLQCILILVMSEKKLLSTCLYVTAKNMPHPHPFHPQPAWNGQIHVLAHSADALHWVAGHNWAPNEPMIQSSSPGRHKTRVLAKSGNRGWEWCKLTNLCYWND